MSGLFRWRSCDKCTEANKRDYGCKEEAASPEYHLQIKGNDDLLKRCPFAVVKPWHFRMVQATGLLEAGVLPDPGGWYDQSAAFGRAACIVTAAKAEELKSNG